MRRYSQIVSIVTRCQRARWLTSCGIFDGPSVCATRFGSEMMRYGRFVRSMCSCTRKVISMSSQVNFGENPPTSITTSRRHMP